MPQELMPNFFEPGTGHDVVRNTLFRAQLRDKARNATVVHTIHSS